MKLILTADVENVGVAGDVVEVKDGYGRNYLLPRGLAIEASRGALKQIEGIKRAQDARAVRDLEHAKELKAAIEDAGVITLEVRTSPDGKKLFGSVKQNDVAAAIKAAGGPVVDRRSIELPKDHIKAPGKHEVFVHLHPEVSARFHLTVVSAQ